MKFPAVASLFVVAAILAAFPAVGAPVISEFQAENKDTITDEDGTHSDWLEIFNPDATAVNLAGMGLTDDAGLALKWVFPPVSVPPFGALRVWCSGKNRVNSAASLHTNFQLNKGGGYLALFAANGTTKLSEWNLYPEQFEDRSYGLPETFVSVPQTPLAAGAACKWRVPTGIMTGWETKDFVDTTWTSAATGIGYDTNFTTDYRPLIGAGGTVPTATVSCYVRVPFAITDASLVQTMTLRMKFDDGFAAFLNGTRLNPPAAADTNAPASLAFNSVATVGRADSSAIVFQPYDISAQRSLLIEGTNVLAIQALNTGTASSDLLMVPELAVTKVNSVTLGASGYFAAPTPGAANPTSSVAGFVDAPDFSVKRGFFTDPVDVTLTTHTPGAQIRYTTNGTAPTAATGTVYTTVPVPIAASSVLRAGAFLTGWQPSAVKSHSYIFAAQVVNQPAAPAGYPTTWGNEYDNTTGTLTGPAVPADYRMDPGVTSAPAYSALMVPALTTTLPVLSLSGDINQIFNPATGIYSNARLTDDLELAASIEFWNPGSVAENWQENVGIRMHGGDAPFEHPKKPFRVYFRKDYGVGRLRQPLFAGSPVESFDKLQLRPGGHDGWSVPFGSGNESLARHAVYCRDRFLRQTELDMGRLSPRGRYVHLYINGLYWGFYDLHEVESKEFFADHLGGGDDDWDVIEHSNVDTPRVSVVDGSDTAINAALALVRPAINASNEATYNALAQYIDYNEFIDNLIVQMWGAQNDWMGPVFTGIPGVNLTDASRFFNKNWEAGRRSRGGDPTGFFWQVWDAEISMGNSLSSRVPTMRVTDFNHTLIGTPRTEISYYAGDGSNQTQPGPPAEIFYALRKFNAAFRMNVADRLQKHFFNGGAMTVANNQARFQTFRDLLDLPAVPESARWGDVNSGDPTVVTFTRNEHWYSEMDWLKNTYIPTRNNTLLSQFAAIGMWPATQPPSFAQYGGTVPSGYQLAITDPNAAGGTVFYTLDGSDPMAAIQNVVGTLLGPGMATTAQYKVPTETYSGNYWKAVTAPWNLVPYPTSPAGGRNAAQELASWSTGPVGLGFDAESTFGSHLATTVAGMQGVRSSLYVRVPFTVTAEQKATMTRLILNLKYDDGAFVFLNGSTPLLRLNAPGTSPAFSDKATAERLDSSAVIYESLDMTAYIPSLTVGSNNLLAIQGLNLTDADNDFLCVPEMLYTYNPAPGQGVAAAAYSGPVTLPQSGTVKSRVLKNGVWSALTEASFIVGQPASATNLTIAEFSYNPVASAAEILAGYTDQMFEYLELMNISTSPVELNGCRFDDGISFDFSVNSSVQTIAPGQRILLVSNLAAFTARHPGVPVAGVFANASNLSNGGERLELLSAAGADIFDFVYDDVPPWPVSPDAGGTTLVLINPMADPDPGIAANWRASVAAGGSPGGSDADSFAAWSSRNSIAGGMSDDSNGNGLSNLAEYGLGLTPSSDETDGIFSAQFESVTVAGTPDTYLVMRFRRNFAADDVTVTPEMSADMVTWTPLTHGVPPDITNPDGTEDLARRSPLPVSGGNRVYVRVSVTTR